MDRRTLASAPGTTSSGIRRAIRPYAREDSPRIRATRSGNSPRNRASRSGTSAGERRWIAVAVDPTPRSIDERILASDERIVASDRRTLASALETTRSADGSPPRRRWVLVEEPRCQSCGTRDPWNQRGRAAVAIAVRPLPSDERTATIGRRTRSVAPATTASAGGSRSTRPRTPADARRNRSRRTERSRNGNRPATVGTVSPAARPHRTRWSAPRLCSVQYWPPQVGHVNRMASIPHRAQPRDAPPWGPVDAADPQA